MLVLARHIGKSFFIGEDEAITLNVVSNEGYKIRIGIEAPQAVCITRLARYLKPPSHNKTHVSKRHVSCIMWSH